MDQAGARQNLEKLSQHCDPSISIVPTAAKGAHNVRVVTHLIREILENLPDPYFEALNKGISG